VLRAALVAVESCTRSCVESCTGGGLNYLLSGDCKFQREINIEILFVTGCP